MSDASSAVQAAIYEALDAALLVPVFDRVPQNQVPEYVVIGEGNELPADTKTHHGVEHILDINVYTDKRGQKSVKDILATVYTTLHRRTIDVSGFASTMLQFDSQTTFPEPHGFRGLARFRMFTQPL